MIATCVLAGCGMISAMSETPSPESAEQPTTPAEPEKKNNTKGCLLGCGGVIAFFIIAVVGCSILGSNSGSNWTPTSTEATTICHDWVKEKLKAPATAKFSGDDASGSSGSYVITGNVDSQNSFGALVRGTWTCTIKYTDSDEKWHGDAVVSG